MARDSVVKVAFVGDSAPLVRATAVATGALDRLQMKAREVEATTHKSFLTSKTFALGLAAAGFEALKAAGNYQQLTTQLVTGAGESQQSLKMVSDGLLKMAGEVGVSAKDLAKGMYLVESAGFHGANGLAVMRAAAEGAKVGAADMETVSNALTSALNAYHLPASKAVTVTNELVATEKSGKLHMEELAGALSGVLPIAAKAHISLAQVGGAIATMSAQGTPATVAATYLRQTIGQLENPSKKARNEMAALGLSAVDIAQHLGDRGLTGTLQILNDAIVRKMGPGGLMLLQSLQKASGESGKFNKALNELPPAQQTVVGALATMVGGVKSMQAALQLTGDSSATFNRNVHNIGVASQSTSKHVEGWDLIQKTFNQQLAQGVQKVASLGIQIGTKLMPAALKMLDTFSKTVDFFQRNWAVIGPLAKVLGSLALGIWAANKAAAAFKATMVVLNIEMDANPVGAIVLALEVLAVAFAIAWKKSETFRTIVKTTFAALGEGVLLVIRGILDALGLFARVSNAVFHTHLSRSINAAITKISQLQNSLATLAVPTVVPIYIRVSTDRAPLNPATHAKGFIGPTVAEGLSASGVAGPYTPGQTGAAQVAAAAAQAAAAAAKKRADALAGALQAGTDSANAISAAEKKQSDAAQAAADRKQKAADALQKANDAMRQALTDRLDTAKSIRDSIVSSNSVVRDGLSWTAKDLLSRFRTQMDKVRRFSAAIQEMVRKGYSATIVRQVADAGVSGGMGTAIGLAHASASQVAQFNAVQGGIDRAAGYAGGAVAGQMGPIQIVTKVMLNDRELATAVNNWNRQAAATGHR